MEVWQKRLRERRKTLKGWNRNVEGEFIKKRDVTNKVDVLDKAGDSC